MDTTITAKIVIGIFALLIVIRLLGKKELSQLTPIDFVFLLVLGGLLEEATYDETVSVWNVLYVIALWGILVYLIESLVRKFNKLRPVIKGRPSVIIRNGKLVLKEIKKNNLESEQLRTMLRQQGIFTLKDIRFAVLEPGGQVSVMKTEKAGPVTAEMLGITPKKEVFSYLVVDEGKINYPMLNDLGKSEEWLRKGLRQEGYGDLSKLFYVEWSNEAGFVVVTYE